MNSKSICIIFLGILLGSVAGYSLGYLIYVPQINDLNTSYDVLESERNGLQDQYDALVNDNDDLQEEYTTISSQYNALQIDYASMKTKYVGLSDNVQDFKELLQSYCYLEESFLRVLSSNEVNEVSSVVSSITRSFDIWYSFESIFDYIVDNVVYVNDVNLPYIQTYQHTSVDGDDFITSFTTNTRGEYIQTPQLTLDLEQEDCDDQAILAYAMIGYYNKNIHGTEYNLYIARIGFSEGVGHVAVFMPVQNGEVCIVDPSGHYLTTTSYGSITSKDASSELQKYDTNVWSDKPITNIELYKVNITTGTPTSVKIGSLNEIANFLET